VFATSPFQSGALEFAKVHGIALVSVTEGRFTYETRAMEPAPVLTREEAAQRFGLPTFVGHAYGPDEDGRSTRITVISTKYPEYIMDCLLPRGQPQ
jgi:restriction system protein